MRLSLQPERADEVVTASRRLQRPALFFVEERLRAEGLPLPKYLVAGHAIELSLIESRHDPTRSFADVFLEQLGVAIEFALMTRMYVDRFVLDGEGYDAYQQACVAAVVEATVGLPREDRRVMFAYLNGSKNLERIAREFGIDEERVRGVITATVRAAKPLVASHVVPARRRRRRRRR